MKKILLVLMLLVVFSGYSQKEPITPVEKKNEIHLNAFNVIVFKWLDVSYERVLNEESSVGISLLTNLDKDYAYFRHYSVTPYYRHFFSKGYAKGFFMEAFTMLNSGESDYWYDADIDKQFTDVAFGIGVGGKFLTKGGFVGEVHAGIGRNLFDDNAPEVVPRGGVSFGYRF